MKMKFLEDSSPNGESKAWWGVGLYWIATIIAALIVACVLWDYIYGILIGEPLIRIIPLLLAGSIWLVGWACRHVLARR